MTARPDTKPPGLVGRGARRGRAVGPRSRRRALASAAAVLATCVACSGARPTLSAELISTGPIETTVPTTTSPDAQPTTVPAIGSGRVPTVSGRTGPHAGLGHPVAVIGDSIGAQSSPAIQREFADAGWGRVVIDAQPSRRIPQDKVTVAPYSGVAAVKKVRSSGFDPVTWVIELGTNDIMNTGDDPVALTGLVTTMLDTIGSGHRIVWITVHNGVEPKAASTFNAILQRFDVARPDLVLGSWADIADGKGLVSDDHIHLTTAGEQAFAADLVRAANRLVPDDPPAEPRRPE